MPLVGEHFLHPKATYSQLKENINDREYNVQNRNKKSKNMQQADDKEYVMSVMIKDKNDQLQFLNVSAEAVTELFK